jgi:hypothetical protein
VALNFPLVAVKYGNHRILSVIGGGSQIVMRPAANVFFYRSLLSRLPRFCLCLLEPVGDGKFPFPEAKVFTAFTPKQDAAPYGCFREKSSSFPVGERIFR